MRGKNYVWTDGRSTYFNNNPIKNSVLEEFVVMKYAQLSNTQIKKIEKRTISKHYGNFGCDELAKKNGKKPMSELLKDIFNSSLSDKNILKHYNMGWNDCANNKKERKFKDKLFQNAYYIGWNDYIVGDDVKSVDNQTEEQILKRIKK